MNPPEPWTPTRASGFLGLLSRLNEEVGATIVIITHAAPMAGMAHRVLHLTMEGITSRENKARKKPEEITW